MTDKAVNDLVKTNNYSFNANAGLTIINYSAQGQVSGKGDIVVWSSQNGLFAGANLAGSDIRQNTAMDTAYYNQNVNAEQILNGKVSSAQAQNLKSKL